MSAVRSFPLPAGIAQDVAEGLGRSPKSLPSPLLYDEEGRRLAEQIAALPEYYPSHTERELFETHAADIADRAGRSSALIELGPGAGAATRQLIAALLRRQLALTFYPIDVARAAAAAARQKLSADFSNLVIVPIVAERLEAVRLPAARSPRLVLLPGSRIGDFEPDAALRLLASLRLQLAAGDALLLTADMQRKASVLVPAYNDARRLSARFHLNLLARINRELGGHFDLHQFRHLARWSPEHSRMEIYLESMRPQTIAIDALSFEAVFAAGERIHTANRYKFRPTEVEEMLCRAGFVPEHAWTGPHRWFALHLARVP
jgi:dimethylhistidine N-methyltransferase